MNLTEQGIKDIKNAPKRFEEAIQTINKMGGKMTAFFTTMGKYDYVAIGEAPNDEVAMTFLLGLAAQGNVRTTTLKAFSKDELAKFVSKLPSNK